MVQAEEVAGDESQRDAAFTRASQAVCAIQIADCLPVLFCDRDGACVAAAHAGWRGLSAGVLEQTDGRAARAAIQDLLAWLGPAIGPRAFEVGADVLDAFVAAIPSAQRIHAARPGKVAGRPVRARTSAAGSAPA